MEYIIDCQIFIKLSRQYTNLWNNVFEVGSVELEGYGWRYHTGSYDIVELSC